MNVYDYTGELPIKTKGGEVIASSFNRIVHGGRGAYVEFLDEQINKEVLTVPHNQKWRVLPYPQNPAYYEWWETEDGVKAYHQLQVVDYADYIVGRWYISPRLLQGFEVTGKYDVTKR